MKAIHFSLLMFATTTTLTAAPGGEEKQVALPRLIQVNAFPENRREAVRAVIEALAADRVNAGEFFALVLPGEKELVEVFLKHQSHPDNSRWHGDECKRCRTAFYDPTTGKVVKWQFVR